MTKRDKGDLFVNTATDLRPNEKKATPLLCLCCARPMNTATPYPQLCALCRKDAPGSLVIVGVEVDELETAWRDALRASQVETQERFVAMMEATRRHRAVQRAHRWKHRQGRRVRSAGNEVETMEGAQ